MAKCALKKEYNNCPHLKDSQECGLLEPSCGMREKEEEKGITSEGYVRKKRWYEEIRNREQVNEPIQFEIK